MGEGIRIRFERRHSSFGVRSVNINKASCCARYLRFVAILRRKKDFFQFLMKSAYEVTKRTTPRKLHRVCTFIYLFACFRKRFFIVDYCNNFNNSIKYITIIDYCNKFNAVVLYFNTILFNSLFSFIVF